LKEIQEQVSKLDENDKGAAVRVVFKGSAQEANDYHLALEGIRKTINKKVKPVHLFDAQKITEGENEKKGKEIEQKIVETGHMTEEEVMEVIGEMLKEQVDEEEYLIIYAMAEEIRKDAKEVAQQ
jgi:hypothetical protein